MPAHLRLGKGTAASYARPWFARCETGGHAQPDAHEEPQQDKAACPGLETQCIEGPENEISAAPAPPARRYRRF